MAINAPALRKIRSAIKAIYSYAANESLVCVSKAGVSTTVNALIQNTTSVTDSLVVDQAGSRFGTYVEATVHTDELTSNNIVLDNIVYFKIDGDRYDYTVTDGPNSKIVPLGPLHNLVILYLNRAVELESSSTVTTIGYVE
jgi:hypothetical protein